MSLLEEALSKWSYRVSTKKLIIELSFSSQPVLTLNLNGLKAFTDEVFYKKETQSRVSQVCLAFLELYRKRYPTVKKSIKDFQPKEKLCFQQILDIIDGLNEKYPEFKLNYNRYLRIHFLFYSDNFNTAPKPSYFTTDNAVRRTDQLIRHFDEQWPGDAIVEDYFKTNPSQASPKAKEVGQEKTHDIRLTGLPIWTTTHDTDTSLKDNSKFQSHKARVLNQTASIYEARYVRDCYHVRNSVDTMPAAIDEYIEELEQLAQTLNIKLR